MLILTKKILLTKISCVLETQRMHTYLMHACAPLTLQKRYWQMLGDYGNVMMTIDMSLFIDISGFLYGLFKCILLAYLYVVRWFIMCLSGGYAKGKGSCSNIHHSCIFGSLFIESLVCCVLQILKMAQRPRMTPALGRKLIGWLSISADVSLPQHGENKWQSFSARAGQH